VKVDFELRGCPISKAQLLEVITALLHGRAPLVPTHSVCMECKQRGATCVLIAQGIPCLGPVTQAGCGAICPAYLRGCYGCFGPNESPNPLSLARVWREMGASDGEIVRALRAFTVGAEPFARAAQAIERGQEGR
jgi:coenzyme F420-reducing hydrogenase gamma subunit